MTKFSFPLLLLAFFSCLESASAQTTELPDKAINIPTGWLRRMQSHITGLNDQLSRETQRYLQKMARYEDRLKQRLSHVDPKAAEALFSGTTQRYADLGRQLATDTGSKGRSFNSTYLPYLDSLHGSLAFLQEHPEWLQSHGAGPSATSLTQLKAAASQLQALQAKMQDADAIKSYVQQRRQQIAQYFNQHANWQQFLGASYAGMSKEGYYYSQQLRAYDAMWSSPDQLEGKTLALLNQVPGFHNFMLTHSSLGGLFRVPGNYGSASALSGLQTKEAVAQQIQGKVSAGGVAGPAALQ